MEKQQCLEIFYDGVKHSEFLYDNKATIKDLKNFLSIENGLYHNDINIIYNKSLMKDDALILAKVASNFSA